MDYYQRKLEMSRLALYKNHLKDLADNYPYLLDIQSDLRTPPDPSGQRTQAIVIIAFFLMSMPVMDVGPVSV